MRKRIVIAGFAVFLAGLVPVATPAGEEKSAAESGPAPKAEAPVKELDPVVVTATRREMLLSDVPDVLQVVTRKEIETLNPYKLADVLEYLPGVSVETGTGSGLPKRSIISLNGLPPNYTVVMVDGVRLLSDHIHTGQNLELIAPGAIERIEIIRGAASAQYGADAIGGVVNIITRRCGSEPATSVGVSAGSYNTYSADVSLFQPAHEKVRIAMFANRESSDGIPLQEPAHRIGNVGYERHIGMARVDADLSDDTKLFGWVNAVDVTSDWQDGDADSDLVMMAMGGSHQLTESLAFNSQVSFSKWTSEVSEEENKLLQPEANVVWQINPAHVLTAGADVRHNEFERTSALDLPNQTSVGTYLQHEWQVLEDTLTLMSAVRLDKVEDVEAAVSPKVSVLYTPELPLRLRGSISRGFHAPTLQELYEVGYGHGGRALRFGNEDLDPEYSMTYAAGLELFPVERLQLGVYTQYSDIDDMIVPVYEGAWDVDPTKDVWRRTNIEDAWVFSTEIAARYALTRNLRLEGGYTYTDNEDKDRGRQLPYDPGDSLSGKVLFDWDLTRDWKVGTFVGVRAVFDRSAWNWKPATGAAVDDPDGMTTDLEDYEKLDAGMTVSYRDTLSFFLNLDNILEEDIENLDDSHTIIEGEMIFRLGLRWDF